MSLDKKNWCRKLTSVMQ